MASAPVALAGGRGGKPGAAGGSSGACCGVAAFIEAAVAAGGTDRTGCNGVDTPADDDGVDTPIPASMAITCASFAAIRAA